MRVSIKRVYETPVSTDGQRILVDRFWPRGLTKEKARIDLWLRDIAPSTDLIKWFGHDPVKWPEFQIRYQAELEDNPALAELTQLCGKTKVTLVYAAKDENHNNAVVLQNILQGGS